MYCTGAANSDLGVRILSAFSAASSKAIDSSWKWMPTGHTKPANYTGC